MLGQIQDRAELYSVRISSLYQSVSTVKLNLKKREKRRKPLPEVFRVGKESERDGAPIQNFQTDVFVHLHENRFQVARVARVNLPGRTEKYI